MRKYTTKATKVGVSEAQFPETRPLPVEGQSWRCADKATRHRDLNEGKLIRFGERQNHRISAILLDTLRIALD